MEIRNGDYAIPASGPGESKLIKLKPFKAQGDHTGSIVPPVIDPDDAVEEQFENNNITPSARLSR